MSWLCVPLLWNQKCGRWELIASCASESSVEARSSLLMQVDGYKNLPESWTMLLVLDSHGPFHRKSGSTIRLRDAETGALDREKHRKLELYCLRCEAELHAAGLELPVGRP